MKSEVLRRLSDPRQLDRIFEEPCSVLFKHSTRCPVSARALREVEDFGRCHPKVPLYVIYVIEDGAVSRCVAEQTKVPHQSPQVIVLKEGSVVWEGSHLEITSDSLQKQLEHTNPESGSA